MRRGRFIRVWGCGIAFRCGRSHALYRLRAVLRLVASRNSVPTQREDHAEARGKSRSDRLPRRAPVRRDTILGDLDGFALEGGLLGVGEGVLCLEGGDRRGGRGLGAVVGVGGFFAEGLELLGFATESADFDGAGFGDEIAHKEFSHGLTAPWGEEPRR